MNKALSILLVILVSLPVMAENLGSFRKIRMDKPLENKVMSEVKRLTLQNESVLQLVEQSFSQLQKYRLYQEWQRRQDNANTAARGTVVVSTLGCGIIGATAMENPKLLWLKVATGGCAAGAITATTWIHKRLGNIDDLTKNQKEEWKAIQSLVAKIEYNLKLSGEYRQARGSIEMAYALPLETPRMRYPDLPDMPH